MENKSITTALARDLSTDVRTIHELNNALAEALKEHALQLDTVSLPGFGSFSSSKNSEKIVVEDSKRKLLPPSIRLSFRSSVVLRKRLSKK